MKLAIIADTHLGYPRFEEDAFKQAERALSEAEKGADIIIIAGDIFDTKIPKLETLKRAADMVKGRKKPIYLIHGNHERRSKDMVNPVQLIAGLAGVNYIHNQTASVEIGGEGLSITGMGSVPEEFAPGLVKKIAGEAGTGGNDVFKVLVIHQSIKELVYGGEEELSLDALRELPFDLIINGHIHQHHAELGGKLLIPGSTVITQLRSDEQGERGYFLYDTKTRAHEFVCIPSRLFFYGDVKLEHASLEDARAAVERKISELRAGHPDAIVKVKVGGTLKEGLSASDLRLDFQDSVYVQNNVNAESMGEKIKRMREKHEENASVREVALRRLRQRLEGRITLFEPVEFFEKLAEGAEEGLKHLDSRNASNSG